MLVIYCITFTTGVKLPVTLESWRLCLVMDYVSQGDYMVALDLKDAYFSVQFFSHTANICALFGETKDVILSSAFWI